MSETKPPSLLLTGGPYDGVRVGEAVPDVALIGPKRTRYEVVRDPDTGKRLCLAYAPEPLDEVFDLQDTRSDRPAGWRWPRWLRNLSARR